MTNNNDPDDNVMASVFPADRPMSFVAEAPLTVIAPAGYNNTATVAFAVATTTGTAAATQCAGAATLAASENAVPTHVSAMAAGAATLAALENAAPTHASAMAASQATLVAMKAPPEHDNAHFDTAPLLNVAVATTIGLTATHVAATLVAYSGIANAAKTEAVSNATLVT